jgi:hypothetical protein
MKPFPSHTVGCTHGYTVYASIVVMLRVLLAYS